MSKEVKEGKGGKTVYMKYDKVGGKSPLGDLDVKAWVPRNNVVILKAERIKRDSGLYLPDTIENRGDTYNWSIFKTDKFNEDLEFGMSVILADYTPLTAIFPLHNESEDVSYWYTRGHNVVMYSK